MTTQTHQQVKPHSQEEKSDLTCDVTMTTGTTATHPKPNVCDRRWIDKDFLKEKLRVRERYWHHHHEEDGVSQLLLPSASSTTTLPVKPPTHGRPCSWVLPDGRAWRTYLPLINRLVEEAEEEEDDDEQSSSTKVFFPWVLLESQVDVMDHNNVSTRRNSMKTARKNHRYHQGGQTEENGENKVSDPQVLPPEKAAPQERSKLQKLILQSRNSSNNSNNKNKKTAVVPFCDLSVRVDDDEWDILKYEDMNVEERSQHSLLRAGRMILSSSSSHSAEQEEVCVLCGHTSDSNEYQRLKRFADDDDDDDEEEEDQTDNHENNGKPTTKIRVVSIDQLLEQWYSSQSMSKKLEQVKQLARRCEEDYMNRNDVSLTNDRSKNNSDTEIRQQTEYWTEEELQHGLQNKTLFRGRLNVTKDNPKEGFVEVHDANHNSDDITSSTQYFINNTTPYYRHFNRAFHQDVVIIKPLPKSEWTRPVGRRRLVHVREDDSGVTDDDSGENGEIQVNMADLAGSDGDNDPKTVPCARVVGVLKESRRQYVATVVDDPINTTSSSESAFLVVPMNILIPKIRIRSSGGWQRYVGYRLWVQVDGWDVGSNYPSGHIIDRLGPIGELETEITCLLKENQIDLEPFSAAAMSMLPVEGHEWKIPTKEIEQRRDLRSTHRIFSVDPVGCQDIDDTMHARRLPNGDIEIGVHIADVTYWMEANSPLDVEAQKRGTTFYLVDRRFDMLPSLLSSDLCSLHGDTDRLAVSTIWTFSNDLKQVKDFWYGRTVIHNAQAMTYDQAHNILHDLPPDSCKDPEQAVPPLTAGYPVKADNINPLKEDLSILTKLARILRKDRELIGGAVDLSSGDQGSELKFSLDENNNPFKVTPKKQQEIHHTIAELMILANTWVARTIVDRFPESALLRIHRSVDESRFQDLKEVLNAGRISFDGRSNMKLAESLKKAETKTSSAVTALFQSLATRAMSEAQYISTGQTKGEGGLSHYGLGLEKYTHFTSPIRRYADVVVHRQLLLSLIPKDQKHIAPPPGFGAKALESLPGSETISILRGEGLLSPTEELNEQNHSRSDSMAHKSVTSDISSVSLTSKETTKSNSHSHLYKNKEVSQICEILNRQNRMAKLSSYECQGLFLSLYFKKHAERTQAVVTNLRSNGFWAYVPKFDFRAPVFLSDKNGDLQIDPALLKLSRSSGVQPSAAFASSGTARKFPTGKCTLQQSNSNEHLEVAVSEAKVKYEVRVLDVVSVDIFCDDWNTKARVPQPRLHLTATSSRPKPSSSIESITHSMKSLSSSQNLDTQTQQTSSQNNTDVLSVYNNILNIDRGPILNEKLRFEEPKERPHDSSKSGPATIPGRLVFGGFVNPDTRSAQQSKAIQDASSAAIERRNQALAHHEKQNAYSTNSQIEKDVTARMQRLAASKRNTRKGKGN